MSYKVIIIEDEPPASKRLESMLKDCSVAMEVIEVLDSVEDSVAYLERFNTYDLIFMDIQLGDGLSFDIFKQVNITKPIIFTTAYDEYTLQAFKVNSIDYLLKPIDQEDLEKAVKKFNENQNGKMSSFDVSHITELLKKPSYKSRFLIKKGKQLLIVATDDVAYFFSEDGYTMLGHKNGSKFIVDQTIDQLVEVLDPSRFHRINRKMVVSLECISEIHEYFNSRLKLDVKPRASFEVIVSRERVKAFKSWLSNS